MVQLQLYIQSQGEDKANSLSTENVDSATIAASTEIEQETRISTPENETPRCNQVTTEIIETNNPVESVNKDEIEMDDFLNRDMLDDECKEVIEERKSIIPATEMPVTSGTQTIESQGSPALQEVTTDLADQSQEPARDIDDKVVETTADSRDISNPAAETLVEGGTDSAEVVSNPAYGDVLDAITEKIDVPVNNQVLSTAAAATRGRKLNSIDFIRDEDVASHIQVGNSFDQLIFSGVYIRDEDPVLA